MMRATWLKVGTGFVAGVAMTAGISTAVRAHGSDEVEGQVRTHLPDPRSYSFVALPTTAPPRSAFVQTSSYADPLRSGQVVLLEYPPFTVYACAAVPGYTRRGACSTRGKVLLRTVLVDGVVTRYSVGTKSLGDPRAAAPGLFQAIKDYVTGAHVTTRPAWVPGYAEAQLRRMY